MAVRLLLHGQNRFARFVTWVSFIGLALGVMILTVVVTVMNGFDNELKQRLLKSIPHITVANVSTDHPIHEFALAHPSVISSHNYFQGLGAISYSGAVFPVTLYGLDEQGIAALDYLDSNMRSGTLNDLLAAPSGIVVGRPRAAQLGLRIGDPVIVIATAAAGESVRPETFRLNLTGTFELGADPDYSLTLVNLAGRSTEQWRQLGELGLQIQVVDPLVAENVVAALRVQFPDLQLASWSENYGELFQAVKLEKTLMFILLLLVVAIATFNIVAGQIMMVNDKSSDIAILRTMGATQSQVGSLFLSQGVLISVLGTVIGLGLGIAVALNINPILDGVEAITGRHLLDGSYFVTVPTLLSASDLAIIASLTGLLCLISAWVPARRAAQLDPVNALHKQG